MNKGGVSLVVAVVLATAVFAVPTGDAQLQRHRPSVAKQLRIELHATRATLARASAQLARIRAKLLDSRVASATVRREVSVLQTTLTRAQAHLVAADAESAVVKARLKTPRPLAVAVEQVRREVAYVQGGVPGYSRGQLISQAAMDYVAGHVSDTAYGYLAAFGGILPAPTADRALGTQAGICTGAAMSFAAIVHRFGFGVRSVNFYYDDPPPNAGPDGHVAVEVLYEGGWHFFDPTFGLFWKGADGKVLSISDVRTGLGTMQKNVAAFTNVFEDAIFGNDAWFITDPATRIALHATELIPRK